MIELPSAIAAYFGADKGDPDAVAACFTDDALVTDEKKEHRGKDAIRAWKAESTSAYTYTTEPFDIAVADGKTIVTSHLVGNFPGSPIDLRYFFRLEGDKIAELEIKV
ncbi:MULTISPECIES: nuclear transport factor 2 family protein [unclassified Sphingobium]|uniref:nuclear transport factor 2 family protein n=1 Tax=unclassified Sphingobium TaxID=2611147 RepID=UPI0035A5D390